MKPADFRNTTFSDLQAHLSSGRAAVLMAWLEHGPCTTEQLAERSGLSILSLRPRTTELFKLGFVCLAAEQLCKGEGTYRARTDAEIVAWLDAQQQATVIVQPELSFR